MRQRGIFLIGFPCASHPSGSGKTPPFSFWSRICRHAAAVGHSSSVSAAATCLANLRKTLAASARSSAVGAGSKGRSSAGSTAQPLLELYGNPVERGSQDLLEGVPSDARLEAPVGEHLQVQALRPLVSKVMRSDLPDKLDDRLVCALTVDGRVTFRSSANWPRRSGSVCSHCVRPPPSSSDGSTQWPDVELAAQTASTEKSSPNEIASACAPESSKRSPYFASSGALTAS